MADGGAPDPVAAAEAAILRGLADLVGDRIRQIGPGTPATGDPADVWVVHPEPNHWSATEALRAVEVASAGEGVVLLHSVGWPTATRDRYPDPSRLPTDAIHPNTTALSVRPDAAEPGVSGLRAGSGGAWAIHDGGARNGVGTALDDFLVAHPGRTARRLRIGTGLAVVWPADAAYAETICERLTGWCGEEVLLAVDGERLALLARVADLEARLAAAGDAGPRLRGENARLRARVQAHDAALDEIARDADQLMYSSVLRAIDAAERVARRRRPGSSFRQRLLAIRDRATDARRDG